MYLTTAIEASDESTAYNLEKEYCQKYKIGINTLLFYLKKLVRSDILKKEMIQKDNRTKIIYKKTPEFKYFKDRLVRLHDSLYIGDKEVQW